MLPFILCLLFAASQADESPAFLARSTEMTVLLGTDVVLPCAVSHLGDYQVIWVRSDNSLLTIEERRIADDPRINIVRPYLADWNLVIRNVEVEDSGQYQCQVNTIPVMSTTVTLTVTDPRPRFLETASNVTATVGDTAVLPCAIDELNHYKVLWVSPDQTALTLEDRRVAFDERISVERPYLTDWNLVIRAVDLQDSGQYQCQINTSPVMITSVTLTVTDPEPQAPQPGPRFQETASNVTASVGDTAVLPCAISDLNDHEVIWVDPRHELLSFLDRRLTDDKRMSVERPYLDEWSLHIHDVALSDSGRYECRVNSLPPMSKFVLLTVKEKRTRFLEIPSNVTATVGDTVVLPCAISGLNAHTVSWLNPHGDPLTLEEEVKAADNRMSVERPFLKDWNLVIQDVDLSDSGQYQCQIDTFPVMSLSVTLTVTEAGQHGSQGRPRMFETASNATATAGDTAVLPCAIGGLSNYTDLDYYVTVWQTSSSGVLTYQDRRFIDDPRVNVQPQTFDLSIRDVQVSDSGQYTCEINTSPPKLHTVTLTVTEEPGQDKNKPQISQNISMARAATSVAARFLIVLAILVGCLCCF